MNECICRQTPLTHYHSALHWIYEYRTCIGPHMATMLDGILFYLAMYSDAFPITLGAGTLTVKSRCLVRIRSPDSCTLLLQVYKAFS